MTLARQAKKVSRKNYLFFFTQFLLINSDLPTTWAQDDQGAYYIPFGVHLPTTQHCIVYDSQTVSTIEDSKSLTQLSWGQPC